MSKLAFIYNPISGKGNMKGELSEMVELFSRYGYEVTCIPTQRKNHCRDYVKNNGAGFNVIVAAGGDGTINEVFNGLCRIPFENRPATGYIPMGTTNDFATSCKLSCDYIKAAKTAVAGKEMLIDAGKFNENYFAYVAAFGAFTSVSYDTSREAKSLFGYGAYVFEGIKSLGNIKPYKMRIKCPQKEFEDEFIFGMAANSKSVGGVSLEGLKVDLSDGLFEVLLIKKFKPTELNMVLSDLRNKKKDSRFYYAFKTCRLEILSHEPVPWTIDGEFGGEMMEAVIENIPSAIKIRIEE